MIVFLLAVSLTVVVHELGHILAIIIINSKEKRKLLQFKIQVNIKYFYVIHDKYSNPFYNLMVAIAGPVAPVLLAILFVNLGRGNFITVFLLTSLFNLLFMHPSLPDGKNIIRSIKEMG